MIYALDTDTFSHLVRNHPRVVANFAAVVNGGADEVTIPVVVRAEVLRGRLDALTKAADGPAFLYLDGLLRITEAALAKFRILHASPQAAAKFDQLFKIKKLAGRNRADLLIASITLAHHATIVTANTQHFANVPGLKIVDWTR